LIEQKDEEWKEYEEIKKDYSGLKIESLKIDNDGSNAGDDDDNELDEVPKPQNVSFFVADGKEARVFILVKYFQPWADLLKLSTHCRCKSLRI
jgi:hypothetical protein